MLQTPRKGSGQTIATTLLSPDCSRRRRLFDQDKYFQGHGTTTGSNFRKTSRSILDRRALAQSGFARFEASENADRERVREGPNASPFAKQDRKPGRRPTVLALLVQHPELGKMWPPLYCVESTSLGQRTERSWPMLGSRTMNLNSWTRSYAPNWDRLMALPTASCRSASSSRTDLILLDGTPD